MNLLRKTAHWNANIRNRHLRSKEKMVRKVPKKQGSNTFAINKATVEIIKKTRTKAIFLKRTCSHSWVVNHCTHKILTATYLSSKKIFKKQKLNFMLARWSTDLRARNHLLTVCEILRQALKGVERILVKMTISYKVRVSRQTKVK